MDPPGVATNVAVGLVQSPTLWYNAIGAKPWIYSTMPVGNR